MIKKVCKQIDSHISLKVLTKVLVILGILYLLTLTQKTWGGWISLIFSVIQPFIIGFVIAYVTNPLVEFFEKKKVPKALVISCFWIVIVIIITLLVLLLIPMLYMRMSGFVGSLISSIEWISEQIKALVQVKDFSLVNAITDTLINFLESYKSWLPSVVSNIQGWMGVLMDFVTNSMFTIIIAVYLQFDFDRIKNKMKALICYFFKNSEDYLHEINLDVSVYIQSMLILIVIRFVEYSAFYFIIGHPDWLIIGFLSAIAAIIPYIGGIIANVFGILTGLTLPLPNLIALLVGIVVLSSADNYVISPIVHKKRSAVGPLLTLFAIFAGSVAGGMAGIIIAMPLVIAIRSCIEVYERKHGSIFDKKKIEV